MKPNSDAGTIQRVLMVSGGSVMDVAVEGLIGNRPDVSMASVAFVDEPTLRERFLKVG